MIESSLISTWSSMATLRMRQTTGRYRRCLDEVRVGQAREDAGSDEVVEDVESDDTRWGNFSNLRVLRRP